MQYYSGDTFHVELIWDHKDDPMKVLNNTLFRLVLRDSDGTFVWCDQFNRTVTIDDLLLRGIPTEDAMKILEDVKQLPVNKCLRGELRITWGEMEDYY